MTSATLAKIESRTAAEICRHVALGPVAAELAPDKLTPRQFLDALILKERFAEAVRFLAYALPKREAVWWACAAIRQLGEPREQKLAAALRAAEQWVRDPANESSRAAFAASKEAGLDSPAGCAALGAFLGGESLAPPHLAAVPPGPYMAARAVAGAVMLAAVQSEPQRAPERYRRFLALGFEVADGSKSWK
jgi:hypothetical protein